MKTIKIICVLLAVGVIGAQAAPKTGQAGASKTAKTTAKPAAQAPATKAPAPPKATKQATHTSPMAPRHKAAPPAAETAQAATPATHGKRDPFVSPVVARGPMGPCAGGKRCLAIDQLEVHGVVKGPKGWIAIVTNPAKKTYFLNDNDELYDGSVVKISGDSVLFKQNVLDAMGRTSTRQIEKKLVPGPAV
jgi:Tfp pilus assembly protein PilP